MCSGLELAWVVHGNVPQAFTHLALVNTAFNLAGHPSSAAVQRKDGHRRPASDLIEVLALLTRSPQVFDDAVREKPDGPGVCAGAGFAKPRAMRLQTRLACLSILVLFAGGGCSSNLQPPQSGTGGTPATGGVPGTGGVLGTGGSSSGGQGGAIACGSATCDPGEYCCNAPCSICAPAGSGCVQGCPVSQPDAGTCESLSAAYQVALTAARICNDDVSGQCSQLAVPGLPVSGCPNGCGTVWVNDLAPLTLVRMQWLEAGCQGPGACPQVECQPPIAGQCVGGDGGQALCQTFGTD